MKFLWLAEIEKGIQELEWCSHHFGLYLAPPPELLFGKLIVKSMRNV